MKYLSQMLVAGTFAVGLALSGVAAQAQTAAPAPKQELKPVSPSAMAAAKELLALKNAQAMYASAIPNIVQRTKANLLQNNLNYQKDLDEVALVIAKDLGGRESEVADQMAKIYGNFFTEQELKDLVTFYKTPLGKKLLTEEPHAIASSMGFMNQWAQQTAEKVAEEFRDQMKKRNKPIM
jgi:hypothetical protein